MAGWGEGIGGNLRDRFDDWRSGGTMAFQGWLHGQVSQRLAGGIDGRFIRRGLQRGSMQIESLEFSEPSLVGDELTITIAVVDTSHPKASEYLANFIGHQMTIRIPDQHLEAAAVWAEQAQGGSSDDLEDDLDDGDLDD